MKILRALLVSSLLTVVTAMAGPIVLKVDLSVDKNQETKGKVSKSKKSGTSIPERIITDTRTLEISLSNTSNQDLPDLKVVYYFFAKDVKEKDIVLAKKGEKPVSVKSLGKGSFTSDAAVMRQHTESAKTVSGGKNESTPASGFKFYGYGAQVVAGDQVLAEEFNPPELKASTGLPETSTTPDDKKKSNKKAN